MAVHNPSTTWGGGVTNRLRKMPQPVHNAIVTPHNDPHLCLKPPFSLPRTVASQFGAASPEASLRAGELPFGLVVRVCASPSRQRIRSACPASAPISGCVRRLSYACKPSLLTHGTPRPSARSFPDFGHALAIRPLNGVYCLAGPRDNSSPYPCRISRFGRSKCDWGWESGLSEGPYFISMPTSLGLRTTFFGSILAMWSLAAVPSP